MSELTTYLLLLYSGLNAAVFSQYRVVPKDRNTRDHLAWTARNGDSMQEVRILHRIPLAWEQQG